MTLGQETVVHTWFMRVIPRLRMGVLRDDRREALLRMAGRYGRLEREPTCEGMLRSGGDAGGRFGVTFNETVHRAVRICVQRRLDPDVSVALVARATSLKHHLREAERDVARAIATLHGHGLLSRPSVHFDFAIPLAESDEATSPLDDKGNASCRFVDLASLNESRVTIVGFRSDEPGNDNSSSEGSLERTYPAEAEFLQRCSVGLSNHSSSRFIDYGILRTSDGALRFSQHRLPSSSGLHRLKS